MAPSGTETSNEYDDPSIAELGKNLWDVFLTVTPNFQTRYSTNFNKQRALASDPKLLPKARNCPTKTQVQAVQHVQHGREVSSLASATVERLLCDEAGGMEMTDGSWDWVTAVETCGTNAMLPARGIG